MLISAAGYTSGGGGGGTRDGSEVAAGVSPLAPLINKEQVRIPQDLRLWMGLIYIKELTFKWKIDYFSSVGLALLSLSGDHLVSAISAFLSDCNHVTEYRCKDTSIAISGGLTNFFHEEPTIFNSHQPLLHPQFHSEAGCESYEAHFSHESGNFQEFLEQPEPAAVDKASLDFGGRPETASWEDSYLDLTQQERLITDHPIPDSDVVSLTDGQAISNTTLGRGPAFDEYDSPLGSSTAGLSQEFTFDIDSWASTDLSSFSFAEKSNSTQDVPLVDEETIRLPQAQRTPEPFNTEVPASLRPFEFELDPTFNSSSTSTSSPTSKSSLAIDTDRPPRLALPRIKLPFPCDQCGEGFLSRRNLSGHSKTHQSIMCSVEGCGKKYSSPRALDRHKHAEHRDLYPTRSFKCGNCKYETTRSDRLVRHTRTCQDGRRKPRRKGEDTAKRL